MKNVIMLAGLLILTSCMSFSDKSLRPVRDSITQQMPEIKLEKEFAVSFGGGVFNLIDVLTLNAADVSDMDHVQVAVYKVSAGRHDLDFDDLDFEESVQAKDGDLVWETIVRVRDEGEQVWVLVGMDSERNTLEAVAVFVLEEDELVLINVDGDLDRMIEFALQPAVEHRGRVRTS
ncbi:MAG: DUF4252 domain-containing protein [Pseudohongiella sp.]|nr:DUF4252 domain-containing protein [Pseudohongiella sp.]